MGIHKHHSHRHTSSSTKHSRHHRHGESKSKHKHHTKKKHHHHHRHKHKKKSHHKKHRSTEPEVELESKILQDALDCLEASALTAIQAGNQLTPQALDAIVSSTLSKARRNGEEGEGGEGSEDSDTDTTLSSSEDEIGGSGGAEKKEFKVEMKNVPETKLERKSDQSSRQSAKTNVESSSSKISEYIGIEDRKRSESQSSSKNQLLDSHSSSKDDVDSCSSLKSHSSDSQSSSKDRTVSQSSSNSKNEMEFHSNKILSQSNSEISKIESQSTSGSKNFLSSSNRETQSSFGSKDATGSGSKEKAESQSIKDKMESDSKGKALSQSSSNLKDKEFFQSSSKDKAESDSESSSDDDSPISTKSIPSLANRASKIKIKIGKDLGDAKVERDENSSACCEQNMKQSVVSGSSKVTYVNLKAVSSDVQAKSRAGGTDSDAGGSRVIKKVHNESEGSAPGPKLKSKSPGSKLKSKSPDSNPDSNKEKASKKKKKRLQSRSRSRSRGRSRYCSRSRERSRRISRSKSRDSYNRSKKERSRSRSPYRHYSKSGRYSRSKHRSRSRSRSRKRNHRSHSRSRKRRSHRSRSSSSNSGSRSPARGKKLLKESAKPSEVVQSISAIAKGFSEVVKNKEKQNNISVLTNFCKSLQKKQKLEDELGPEVAAAAESASEETDYRVPFMVGPVPMYQTGYVYHNNTWKSANQIIAETNAANAALVAPRPLTDVFPVSTGIQHKKSSYLDEELPIAAAQKSSAVDISSLAIQRLQASERLKHNPTDFEALSTLATIENQTRQWAASKMIPGQYTGEQTLSPLTREDHKAGIQAWAKKKMFHDLAPVMSGFGMKMLKKMGWNEGRSLGKEGKGCLEPLAMDVKMDRTGLCTEMDKRPPVLQPSPALPTMMIAPTLVATDTKSAHLVQGKHPVSALQEICSKKRWDNPVYELVQAAGPAHNKTFHYQVTVPLGTFKSANASKNKKQAKMEAAAAALQGLGLVDRKQ